MVQTFFELSFEWFSLMLDYQPVFCKMNLHSSVNLLKQVFIKVQEMEYTLKQQNLGITKKLIWVMKEQKSAKFVLRPMHLHVQN